MKKLLLFLIALVLHGCTGGVAPVFAEVEIRRALPVDAPYALTLSEADVRATIAHMQTLAREQVVELDAAKKALADEHAAHLRADAAAVEAGKALAALERTAATATAQRDAEKARADAEAKRARKLEWFLIALAGAVGCAGAWMESALRWIVRTLLGGFAFMVGKATMLWPPLGLPVNALFSAVRLFFAR